MQPSKYSKRDFKTELQKKPKTASKVLDKPTILSYEELGGLSGPGPRDWVHSCCRSKPTGEQRQATRGAGRLPGLLVGPGPSVNGPRVRHTPWLGEVLGVPPDLYLIRKVSKSFVSYLPACTDMLNISPSRDRLLQ
jgi:hypothetical protein